MHDPVIDREGNSYDRKAILDWLRKGNDTSPMTRVPLKEDDLTPNRALKDQIESFKIAKAQESMKKSEKEDDKSHTGTSYVILPGNGVDTKLDISLSLHNAAAIDGISSLETETDLLCLATIKGPKEEQKRAPVDICCVIDVSGSMGNTATIKNANGNTESNGLTILDVVKHGVKTIMEVLSPEDSLSIVAYSTNARVVCPLLRMDKAGKQKINLGLANMVPTNSTNIWDGLHKGMEVLRMRSNNKFYTNTTKKLNPGFVMLLTDGLPNVVPPRGHIPMLKRYLDANPDLDVTINTYGFGYNLDSSLLNDIAATTKGMYSFIPDSSFVGTIFVNSISNILSTNATNVKLSIEPTDDAVYEIEKVYGDQSLLKKASWGIDLNVGKLQHGQDRSFLLRLKLKKEVERDQNLKKGADNNLNLVAAKLTYTPVGANNVMVTTTSESIHGNHKNDISNELYRLSIYEYIAKAINLLSPNTNTDSYGTVRLNYDDVTYTEKVVPLIGKLAQLAKFVKGFNSTEYLLGLEQDVNGQIFMGISTKKAYVKWGKHFMLSLLRAHALQQCLNFKDPGVQFYGGKLFNEIRDLADDKFNKLPAPKPRPGYTGSRVASMRSYNSRSAGCFDGNGKVTLGDGQSTKLVKDLKRGDKVLTRNGVIAEIVCMIRTKMIHSQCEMVELTNGVKLTPWHPVYINNEWKFPNNIGKLVLYDNIDYIYNAVVDKGHSLMINGVHCVTLGHHLKENKVVEHPYFGTDMVLNTLKETDPEGWKNGYIDMIEGVHKTLRDKETGLIIGMTNAKNAASFSCSFAEASKEAKIEF
eukprot:g5209.t1